MDLGLNGKVVVVAGATGVIGAAAARLLAQEGASLALLARSRARLATLVSECRESTPEVEAFAADLTDAASTDSAFAALVARFGRIDAIVAAAGAAQGGIFWQLDDAAWHGNLELKLFGTIRLLRAAIPQLIAQQSGRIVLVAGNSAKQPEPRMLPGAAANAALLAIVRGLAMELGPHGIAINAVNPGPTRSPRWDTMMAAAATLAGVTAGESEKPFIESTALRRLASPEQIAQHIVFLASGRAAHMTGTSVTIDGGATRTP